jgi:hypothetical protein
MLIVLRTVSMAIRSTTSESSASSRIRGTRQLRHYFRFP